MELNNLFCVKEITHTHTHTNTHFYSDERFLPAYMRDCLKRKGFQAWTVGIHHPVACIFR